MKNPIFEELKVLRDEIKVQAHLFSMEAQDEFELVEKKFESLKQDVENSAQKIGEISEEIWIGKAMELKNLKKEYQKLKESHVKGH